MLDTLKLCLEKATTLAFFFFFNNKKETELYTSGSLSGESLNAREKNNLAEERRNNLLLDGLWKLWQNISLTKCLTGLEKEELTKEKLTCLYKKSKLRLKERNNYIRDSTKHINNPHPHRPRQRTLLFKKRKTFYEKFYFNSQERQTQQWF